MTAPEIAARVEHARALIGEALALARQVMVACYDAGQRAQGKDAEAVADQLHEASMLLSQVSR